MSHGKQFTLYTHLNGPNGWKVEFVLEELGLTFEPIFLDFGKGEHKQPPHTTYNPNGRIPTLIDHHNGDFTIWESNAILLYLIDRYDKEKKLSVTDEKDKYTVLQWLFFQASGQGPYFGQAFWFMNLHAEKIPSAITRYQDETKRVLSVLNGVLAASPSGWLVGGKITIADISFVTWNRVAIHATLKPLDIDLEKEYPAFFAWNKKIEEHPSVKKTLARQAELQAQKK